MKGLFLCGTLLLCHLLQAQKAIPLKDALKKVGASYGTQFVYDPQLIEGKTTTYQLTGKKTPVEDVLKTILYPNELVFLYIKANYYSIVSKDRLSAAQHAISTSDGTLPVNAVATVNNSNQKQLTVTGTVKDSKGVALPGASINEKGTENTTLTNEEGSFRIKVRGPGAVLVITSVGLASREVIATDNQTSFNLVLEPTDATLGEVVVVGYGKQKKVNLTGAVSTITMDDKVAGRTLTDVSSALSGLVPGLAVQQNTGMAGNGGSTLILRGLGTVNNAGPLIVVDGMPDVNIDRINPNDIETVSVLKDASSASVYGSRAANGVILITTKTGSRKQKTNFNYSGTYARSSPTKFYDYFADYPRSMTMQNRAAAAGGTAPVFRNGTIEEWMARAFVDPVKYPNTDWWDIILRNNANISTHTLSASGGTDKVNFYISGGVLNQEGLLINNNYKRYNTRINLDYKLKDNLKVGARIDGQWSNQTYPLSNGLTGGTATGGGSYDVRYAVAGILPRDPVTGKWGGAMAYGEDVFARNMLDYMTANHKLNERQEFNGNLYGEWEPLKGMTVRADYGLRYYNGFLKEYADPTDEYNFQTGLLARTVIASSAGIENTMTQGYKTLLQGRINYSRQVFPGHELSVLAAYTEEYWFDRSLYASRNNRIYPALTELDAALTTTQGTGGGSSSEGLRSGIGRINYVMYNKYLLEVNGRYDGSSKFLPGYQYGFFPSASVGWRFTEEAFLSRLKSVVSSGKIRASIGQLGNNSGVGRFEQRDILSLTNYNYNNAVAQGFSATKLINEDFTWEQTNMTNVGLELGFLNGHLTAEIDVYEKITKGMIRPSSLSMLLAGYTAPRVNVGQLQNRGIETNITWTSRIAKANIGATFNFSYNKNKLQKWNEFLGKGDVYLNMPYHFLYSYISTGVAQSWEDIANAPYLGSQFYAPGDVLYKDLNGDGQITGEDRQALPQYNRDRPLGNYGLNLFGNWKGFDASVLLQGATGRKDYWLEPFNEVNVPTPQRQGFNSFLWYDTWTLEHRNAPMPRLMTGSGGANQLQSTYWLQNMNYLRLKNIQVGYNLADRYIRRLGMGRFRVYATAENLLTYTKYKGIDPEKGIRDADNPFPLLKSYSLGINIGF